MRAARPAGVALALAALLAACESTEMTLAPISAAGSLQQTVVHRRDTGGSAETTLQTVAGVAFDSHIWHPWFARVSGDVELAFETVSGAEDSGSSSRANASATLSLLPRSNHPVTLSVSHLDSRVSGDFSGSDFIRDRVGLTARARITQSLRAGASASWQRTDQRESGLRNAVDANLDASKTFSKQEAILGITAISMAAGLRHSDFDAANARREDTALDRATLRVSMRSEPWQDVIIDSQTLASLESFDEGDERERRIIVQGISTLNWRPVDLPFTMTGSLRTLLETTEQGRIDRLSESSSSLASGTLGLRWPITDRLSANAGLRATYEDVSRDEGADLGEIDSETGLRLEGGVLFGLTYRSERHMFRGFDWDWDARAQTDNGVDSEEGFDSTNLFRVGHRLSRRIEDALPVPVLVSLSQSADLENDSDDPDAAVTVGVAHALAFSHDSADAGSNRFVRLFLRDRRDLIGEGDEFQTAQLRLGLRHAFDRDRRIEGNLNAQASREVERDGERAFSASASGEIAYDHRTLFGVEGLAFRSILRLNLIDAEGLFGRADEADAIDDTFRNDWRNLIAYRIGRLLAEGEVTAFHEDSGIGYLILFRLRREFGAAD